MRKRNLIVLSLVLLFSLLALTGCMRQAKLQNPTNLPVYGATGKQLTEAQVKQAILAGAREKGWVAREMGPGLITATLAVRSHLAEVEIPYSANGYSILYVRSSNLDYDARNQTIHNQYNNWVDYLRRAIEARMAEMR